MPKLKMNTTPEETARRVIRSLVRETIGVDQMAADWGICVSSAYHRLKDPLNLSVRDLKTLRKSCGMTRDDFLSLIRECL